VIQNVKYIPKETSIFAQNDKQLYTSILNIGAGKSYPIDISKFKKYFLVNLDKIYRRGVFTTDVENIWENREWQTKTTKCNSDVFEFLSKYYYKFDLITIYRFLEHVPFNEVLYFIYLLSTALEVGGYIDIIVPDYRILANMLLEEDVYGKSFEANNILVTTELLNHPEDPHASIWTASRLVYFFELEGRFEIKLIKPNYTFDGRDIYIRAIAQRVK